MKYFTSLILILIAVVSCKTSNSKNGDYIEDLGNVLPVNKAYFKKANPNTVIKVVECTLSDGTKTKCYEIVTNSIPVDHEMGPWCPETIRDDASAGGIWLENGQVYDVDGAFIQNMAIFYDDETWQMYNENGDIYVTATQEDCINAANPNVGEDYKNFCVECLPSYITGVTQSYLIPIEPVLQKNITLFQGPGGRSQRGGPKSNESKPSRGEIPPKVDRSIGGGPPPRNDQDGFPSARGIALNGVEFSAPAPVDNILGAYTLAPFDDAGGHINVHQGYHYHTATGLSTKIEQEDGHSALIGYAMDGIAIYEYSDSKEGVNDELDELRGHSDDARGYHYHVDQSGANNFINGLKGAFVK